MGADGHLAVHAAKFQSTVSAEKAFYKNLISIMLVCTPILNGVLLTMNSQFSPLSKFNALMWASDMCVSEIYRYRARSQEYNDVPASAGWELPEENKETTAQKFMVRLAWISDQLITDGGMMSTSMDFTDKTISKEQFMHKDENTKEMVLHPKKFKKGKKHHINTKQDKKRHDLLKALPGGALTDEDKTDPHTGDLVYEWLEDDGFEGLSTQYYITMRTIPGLHAIENKLPGLGRRKKCMEALIYLATSVSVLLGTLHYDIYIAISTATISLLTGLMEYQKLERKIVILNSSKNTLEKTIKWWHSLSFVDRRQALNKDKLVEDTEEAMMAETMSFYVDQNPRARDKAGEDDEEEDGEEKEEVLPPQPKEEEPPPAPPKDGDAKPKDDA